LAILNIEGFLFEEKFHNLQFWMINVVGYFRQVADSSFVTLYAFFAYIMLVRPSVMMLSLQNYSTDFEGYLQFIETVLF
jgi:hypothetical protein